VAAAGSAESTVDRTDLDALIRDVCGGSMAMGRFVKILAVASLLGAIWGPMGGSRPPADVH
jgi:hypothetical protein